MQLRVNPLASLQAFQIGYYMKPRIERPEIFLFYLIRASTSLHVPKQPEVNITIKDHKDNSTECTLIGIFGNGGCKVAFEMKGGRALIVPNDMESHEVLEYWERVVKEEVKMGQLLQKLDLLCPKYKQVEITLPQVNVPAYISKSFAQLAEKKGIFVIDVKNPAVSLWKKGLHTFFTNEESKFEESNWHPILEPFAQDVAKLINYGIPIGTDSLNFAVVKKTEGYALRYFGFDFTNKCKKLEIPSGEVVSSDPWRFNESSIRNHFNEALFSLFDTEFNSQGDKVYQMQESLVKWGLEKVLSNLEK